MSRKKGKIKRVFVGPEILSKLKLIEFDWQALDRAIGGQLLSSPSKDKIISLLTPICSLYASTGPRSHDSITVTKLAKTLETWQKHTQRLRNIVWQGGSRRRSPVIDPKKDSRSKLLKVYFSPLAKTKQLYFILKFLAAVLDAALATSEYVSRTVQRKHYVGLDENEMWFIWVALVARILEDADIHVSASSGSSTARNSPFVAFIEKLQHNFEPKRRLRGTVSSLAKGIQKARNRYKDETAGSLTMMLLGRGFAQPKRFDRFSKIGKNTNTSGR